MEEKELKPTQLAKELGLSVSTFTDWGKGKGSPSLNAVIQFSEYFGVSIDYLVYGESKKVVQMEISNREDAALLESFHKLTPELRMKVIGYIEGMIAVMPEPELDQDKLSGGLTIRERYDLYRKRTAFGRRQQDRPYRKRLLAAVLFGYQ
ncbi:MAG: helix-turn-helix transcriptional regulator [Lachnospiraceae bacterium]|nr:helix-turn-helix transcriptional regulator [Lachnospiraceae bacterium]